VRILITTPHCLWPESRGAARRTLGIAYALAGHGHSVELLTPDRHSHNFSAFSDLSYSSYRSLGSAGHFWNPFFFRSLTRALEGGKDIAIAEFPYQSYPLTRLCSRFNVPLVYDAHNCEADRMRKLRGRAVGVLVGRSEAQMVSACQAVLCVSRSDQEMFISRYSHRPMLLPNGVDTRYFTPGLPDEELLARLGLTGKRVALYFGTFDYPPNRQALKRLLSLEWPRRQSGLPDTHLLIVGRNSTECTPTREGVIATGEVDDIAQYIRLANIVLVPLTEGGGTRLKIIEALACGQIVLSTPFGAMGLDNVQDKGVFCCEWNDFDTALNTLLGRPLKPGSNQGGRGWAENMDWLHLTANIDWAEFHCNSK